MKKGIYTLKFCFNRNTRFWVFSRKYRLCLDTFTKFKYIRSNRDD